VTPFATGGGRAPALQLSCAVVTLWAAPAWGQPVNDWFASLYTPEGVELRTDERIFDLYAVFNAMGYDDAPVTRRDPVPKHEFNAVRQRVRTAAAASLDDALRRKIDAFFDSHPQPAASYLAYVVRLSAAPDFKPSAGAGRDLSGFEGLLSSAQSKLKLAEAFQETQDDQRAMLKAYLKEVDAPLAAARKLLKLKDDDEQRTVLALNLLEAPGAAESLWVDKEELVVVGPSPKPNVPAVVREFARLHVAPAVARKASSYKFDVPVGVRGTPSDYVTETAARAVALRAAVPSAAQDAAADGDAKAGYGGVREMMKVLDDYAKTDRSLDAYLAEAWPRVEAVRKR
jgi:hypothetical protein